MLSRVSLCLLALPAIGLAQGPVVINEVLYDNLGGDSSEFG